MSSIGRLLHFMLRIDEEEYGGHQELIAEGLPIAVALFMVRMAMGR